MVNGDSRNAMEIAQSNDLLLDSNPSTMDEIQVFCQSLLLDHQEKVEQVRLGRRSIDYFMGPIMRQFKGKVDPKVVRKVVESIIKKKA